MTNVLLLTLVQRLEISGLRGPLPFKPPCRALPEVLTERGMNGDGAGAPFEPRL